MRSIALSARVPYFLFGPFKLIGIISVIFLLSFLKVSMNNNKKVNFWSQPASVDFTCVKVFIFNAKFGFLFCRVCVLIVWWNLRSDVFVFLSVLYRFGLCGICF